MFMNFICESCGNEYSRSTYIATAAKDTKQYWREKEDTKFGICTDCFKAQKQAEQEVTNQAAAEKAKELELPELIGTEKQIAWANTIRLKMITDAEELGERRKVKPVFYDAINYIVEKRTKASWYIDNRETDLAELIKSTVAEMPGKEETEEKETAKAIEQEIRNECVVYPENCTYKVPAEITVKIDKVLVIFEKNDKFKEIVKGLRYQWQGQWERQISETTGTASDRAAELGNKLLNAGFSISILDADIRNNAINAVYEPECNNWIYAKIKGDYTGWLVISWKGRNEHLYNIARKLPRSRWDSPTVVVKSEYFLEVEEFARLCGFKFTKAAQALVEQAKAVKAAAKVVVPAQAKEVEIKDGLKEILKTGDDVIDDLKD